MTRLLKIIFAMVVAALPVQSAFASMRVDPMIISLEPNGRDSSATVQITNVTDIFLPVEITAVKRILNEGQEELAPADEDFVMFPPQFSLEPGETQTVRLQWVAGTTLEQSQSYYIYATQVPVPLKEGQSGVVVNYRFGISVHIEPEGIEPKLSVLSVVPETNAEGVQGLSMEVLNSGTRYSRMSEYALVLNTSTASKEWNQEELKSATGVGFMLPGETRSFFIPYDGTVDETSTATLQRRAP